MGSLEQEGIHVLMVTLGFQGHINPMLKLAKRLVPRGVRITFATTESARERFLTTVGTKNPDCPSLDMEFFPDGNHKDNEMIIEYMRTTGAKGLSNIITKLKETKKFACVISSPFTPWVPDIAFEHKIPCAMLWIQACAVYSIYYRYFTKANPFPELDDPNQTVELPALPLLEVRDLPSFVLPSSTYYKKLMADFVECLEKVKWVLVNSIYELEQDIIESMASLKPMIPIGPLVSPFLVGEETTLNENLDLWKSDDSCIEWLNKRPPSSVIYISFGSILELTEDQIENIAKALKRTNKSFLWVIRPIEKAANIEILQEMISQNQGMVVAWGPQERVLTHEAVACFVTHCGWNSTLETVTAGVPVIAFPEWTDQPTDARLLVDVFKVGVRMRKGDGGELSVEEVERCIEEVMEGPKAAEMKRRAVELKETARMAVAPGGSSTQNFDRFVGEISKK